MPRSANNKIIFAVLVALTAPAWAQGKAGRKAKLTAWEPQFVEACNVALTPKITKPKAEEFCKCAVKKHSDYVIHKGSDEPFDIDAHLASLIDLYKHPEKYASKDEDDDSITVLDLDMQLTNKCGGGAK